MVVKDKNYDMNYKTVCEFLEDISVDIMHIKTYLKY